VQTVETRITISVRSAVETLARKTRGDFQGKIAVGSMQRRARGYASDPSWSSGSCDL